MKKIRTVDAKDRELGCDIIKNNITLKKGQIIHENDIKALLCAGKEQVYVIEKQDDFISVSDALKILVSVCLNDGMRISQKTPTEIEVFAEKDGVFKVDKDKILAINMIESILISVKFADTPVKQGEKIADIRIIAMRLYKDKFEKVLSLANDRKLLEIRPYNQVKVGIILADEDKDLANRIQKKLSSKVQISSVFMCDIGQKQQIFDAINQFSAQGIELIILAVLHKNTDEDLGVLPTLLGGAEVITYGAPCFKDGDFILARLNKQTDILVVSVQYIEEENRAFDMILARMLSGEKLCKKDFAILGFGNFWENKPN